MEAGQADQGAPVAWHYDGRAATRHAVHVEAVDGGGGFRLLGEGIDSGPHAWDDLVALDRTGGRSVYGLKGVQGWRLIFDGPPPMAFAAHLPRPVHYGRWIDRIGLWRASLAFAAIAVLVVLFALRAPGWIAPYVPRSVENALGDAMVGDFGGRFCRTAEGRRALDRLGAELGRDAAGVRTVEVANIPIVNAITLPGGRVMLFQGLLDQARSADEVAGVLAHEIGHVRHRDTLAALIRQLGLSVVLGGFNGNVGGAVNSMLSLSYTREAESAADGYAIEALAKADIAPDATAAFFDRLGKGEDERIERVANWLQTHPVSATRKHAFLASKVVGRAYRPALTSPEWQALRTMCAHDPAVKKGLPFAW